MPVWGDVISDPGHRPDRVPPRRAAAVPSAETPTVARGQGDVVEGGALYSALRLRQLPRPQRSGRRTQPATPDKTIPPLSGEDFHKEFNTDAKIIAGDPLRQRDR